MSNWEKTEGQNGLEQAEETDQHFWTDAAGAHISSTGDHDTSGFHQLLTSVKNAFMHGTTELMTISADLIELGKNSTNAIIKMCGGIIKVERKYVDETFHYAGIFSETEPIQLGGGGIDGKGQRAGYVEVSPTGVVSMHTNAHFYIDEPTPEGSAPMGFTQYSTNILNNVLSHAIYQGSLVFTVSNSDYVQLWTAAQFAAAFPLITSGNPYIGLTNGDLKAKWLHYLMASINESGNVFAHFGEQITGPIRINYLIVG